MTTTTTTTGYQVPADPVVPAGEDPIDDLLVAELADASRLLGCDVVSAVGDVGSGAGRRWDALPLLAWLWAKRTDPRAKLEPFTQLKADHLTDLLRLGPDNPEDQSPGGPDQDDPDGDPTVPGHGSPSPGPGA